MRAARWYGPGDVRVEQRPDPLPGPAEALIDVLWCGICGSDLEEYTSGPVVIKRPPVTLGHEVVGRVRRAATNGDGPPAGSLVVVDVVDGCGHCWWCLRHEEGLCPDLKVRGFDLDGGLAERMTARAAHLIPVGDDVAPDHAALSEPLSVAVRAAHKCGSLLGRNVLVLGAGAVGQLVARVARCSGARTIVVVDPLRSRRQLAAVAADVTLEPDDLGDLDRWVGEPGIDVVIECVGRLGSITTAVRHVRRGGTVVLLGVPTEPDSLNSLDVVLKEVTIRGSSAHRWDDDVRTALSLIASGAVRVDDLITSRITLDDVVTAGLDRLRDRPQEVVKVLVDCRAGIPA